MLPPLSLVPWDHLENLLHQQWQRRFGGIKRIELAVKHGTPSTSPGPVAVHRTCLLSDLPCVSVMPAMPAPVAPVEAPALPPCLHKLVAALTGGILARAACLGPDNIRR